MLLNMDRSKMGSRAVMIVESTRPADGLMGGRGLQDGKDWVSKKRRIGYMSL